MSPVLIISNRCGSTILSNPTILCDRRFTKFDKLKNIFNGLYVQNFSTYTTFLDFGSAVT